MSDDLDTLIRKAASAHLALAPASVLTSPGVDEDHDLIARAMRRIDDPAYLAQLEPFDPEAVMMSDPDHDDDRDRSRATPPSSTTDDSGLHDIRALAQNAKQRISRKMPVVTDTDDSLLASTTGQLRAIALPEPARLVMLPDLPASADAELTALARATAAKIEARGAAMGATATAADITSIESARPKQRTALWLGIGGAAAAAAVIVVVASGGGSKKNDQVAGAAPSTTTPAALTIESAASGSGAAATPTGAAAAATGSAASGTAAATPPAAPSADEGRVATDERPERDGAARARPGAGSDEPKPSKGSGSGSGSGAATAGAGSGSSKEPRPAVEKSSGDKPGPDTKGAKGPGAPAAGGAPAGGGEKSIDDLLGGSKPPPPTGGDGAPKPEKKGLEGKDIKAGMSPLAGKAQGCFDQHGVAGHVKIKAVVDPSGKVVKVDATGEFAGTPTGSCVAAVVKGGASFPAWDGAQMTINYSYTLNE